MKRNEYLSFSYVTDLGCNLDMTTARSDQYHFTMLNAQSICICFGDLDESVFTMVLQFGSTSLGASVKLVLLVEVQRKGERD